MEKRDIILLDYYDGAYGPTLRIDVQSTPSLLRIKDVFIQLAGSKELTINFTEIPFVKVIGLDQLILKRVVSDKDQEKKLKFVKNNPGEIVFCWVMAASGWELCVDLIHGILDSNHPGHQYLTEEGIDDALVELAFMEFSELGEKYRKLT